MTIIERLFPQELLAEAIWNAMYSGSSYVRLGDIEELMKRHNLKLKKGRTLDDLRLAFSKGFGLATQHKPDLILKKVAEEIDKVCVIARWDLAVGKYSTKGG